MMSRSNLDKSMKMRAVSLNFKSPDFYNHKKRLRMKCIHHKILSVAKQFLRSYLILLAKRFNFLSFKLDGLLRVKKIKGSRKLNLQYA